MSAYRVVGYSGETRSLGSFFVTETYWVGIDDGFEEVGQPLRRTSATVVSGNEWFYAPGGEYVVVRYDAEGRAIRVYRHPDRPPPIAPADLEAYLDDYFGARARAGRLERLMREAPLRERLPGYNRVRVDPLGNLWAHPYPSATAPDCWHVYEIDGGGFARLCVPEEAEILGVGQEYVLVVRTGELGVETVERYRISR